MLQSNKKPALKAKFRLYRCLLAFAKSQVPYCVRNILPSYGSFNSTLVLQGKSLEEEKNNNRGAMFKTSVEKRVKVFGLLEEEKSVFLYPPSCIISFFQQLYSSERYSAPFLRSYDVGGCNSPLP